MERSLLLVSSSVCHPFGYLEHCSDQIERLFSDSELIVFVPYARPGGISHAEYTEKARKKFSEFGKTLRGIEEFESPTRAIQQADGAFIGGGNSFVLLNELYSQSLVVPLRERILNGLPYMGTSAGSNVAGLSIGTSNDMPIVYPPSFMAMEVVPFNINPHFPAEPPDPTHQGETREQRIEEFHVHNSQPVVAIREDSMLYVTGDKLTLHGTRDAVVFNPGESPIAFSPDADLSFLL